MPLVLVATRAARSGPTASSAQGMANARVPELGKETGSAPVTRATLVPPVAPAASTFSRLTKMKKSCCAQNATHPARAIVLAQVQKPVWPASQATLWTQKKAAQTWTSAIQFCINKSRTANLRRIKAPVPRTSSAPTRKAPSPAWPVTNLARAATATGLTRASSAVRVTS